MKLRKCFSRIAAALTAVFIVLAMSSCSMVGGIQGIQGLGEKRYEAMVEFYVNPIKNDGETDEGNSQDDVYGTYGCHVMDNIVKLLNSDMFAEALMQGMDGVPVKESEDGGTSAEYEAWISGEEGEWLLNRVKESIAYSYEQENAEQFLAKSFIYATVSVSEKEGREFAEVLLARVEEATPLFVEDNMAVPDGYVGTNCQQVSRNTIREITKR